MPDKTEVQEARARLLGEQGSPQVLKTRQRFLETEERAISELGTLVQLVRAEDTGASHVLRDAAKELVQAHKVVRDLIQKYWP